jgi:high-affinity iron transporter
VWLGSLTGFLICLCIGAAFIAVWYTLAKDIWGGAEDIWEGAFCLIAAIIITVLGSPLMKLDRKI